MNIALASGGPTGRRNRLRRVLTEAGSVVLAVVLLIWSLLPIYDMFQIALDPEEDSYCRAQFFRLQSRRGPQKAICAVAASILTAIYHMLKSGLPHRDLGANYFDRRWPEAKARRLVSQLAKLGFAVQLQSLADAA